MKRNFESEYKLVADYNEWVEQDNNQDIDIWAIHDYDGKFLFDVLEEDYDKMLDTDIVEEGYLTKRLSVSELNELRRQYGILWTDSLKS